MKTDGRDTMSPRERFLTALRGGVPDRVPLFEFHFGPPFIKAVLGEPVSFWHNADDSVAVARAVGLDMVWTAPLGFTGFTSVQLHGERYQDEWGTWWGTNANSWPAGWTEGDVVKSRADWEQLRIPDPDLPERMEQPRRAVQLAAGELAVVGGVRGPFSAAWMLAGLVNMGMWIYDDPDLLNEILATMARWNTRLGLNLIQAGVDAVIIHDDWGMNKSIFIKPEDWRRLVRPHIAEQVATLAATGTPVLLHSDGNLNAILDDIVELGITALNPLQRSANMDLADVKARYGDRLCLIGNLSTTTTLAHGSVKDVEREVLECLRDAGPGGGYILAPDHSYHSGVPIANTRRALEVGRQYGAYPLDMEAITRRLAELDRTQESRR
jgi:uroporphyrinogen decarboxylase